MTTPWPSSDEALLACTASAWEGDTTRCRWCNSELPPRRRRWCSDECATTWGRNHWWTAASKAAMRRDRRRCVDCRIDPRDAHQAALGAGIDPARARRFLTLQVHHKTPVLGRHGETGCHHHLDGLETVCLHHHLERHHGVQPVQLTLGAVA